MFTCETCHPSRSIRRARSEHCRDGQKRQLVRAKSCSIGRDLVTALYREVQGKHEDSAIWFRGLLKCKQRNM
ncbi:hypothetical protein TNCV_2760391 [Trichonephila clavipes]|nr:hypothetical protein TNCV_2760391 [Trichonephila clavipes]